MSFILRHFFTKTETPMTTLLALDTATEACSVALLHDGKVLSHYEVIPRLHAQRLLPMIKDLLGEAGIAMSALDAIAFGRGPGAFTGVRIAIGVVQGLAFALERPVLPVSNLAVLAQRAFREHGVSQVASAPELATLPVDASGQWFGSGTGWGYAERIPVSLAGHDASMLPHAQDLLTLATFAWNRGEALSADDAQPVY
ncbi:hypothetical protein APX70_01698, partial [Pseudomonas syringae pv. maculicola]